MILTSSSTSVSSAGGAFGRALLVGCGFLPGRRPGRAVGGMTPCLPRQFCAVSLKLNTCIQRRTEDEGSMPTEGVMLWMSRVVTPQVGGGWGSCRPFPVL